jgi:predicted RecA/RadA family phage recombinase
MSVNEIYTKGSELVFQVNATVDSGDLVQVGRLVGVAHNDVVTGEDGNTYATLKLDGVFAFTEPTGSALAVGDVAYGVANATTKIIPNVNDADDAVGAKVIGHVTKVSGDTVHVRLLQTI